MSIRNWPSKLKARVGARSINVMQIILIVSLGSVVLLRDSLGVGIDLSLNPATSAEGDGIESVAGVNDLSGPKRNIASLEEKDGRELEAVPELIDPTDFSYEQPPVGNSNPKRSRDQVEDNDFETEDDPTTSAEEVESIEIEENSTASVSVVQVVDDDLSIDAEPITEFDEARQKRGKPRGKDSRKDLIDETDLSGEVEEVEHMFLTTEEMPREFTIPEDLQDLPPSKESTQDSKAKRSKKHKKQPKEEVPVGGLSDSVESQKLTVDPKPELKEPVFSGKPFSLGKTPQNWGQQRIDWLEKYPWMKTGRNGKPRMLMITGSSPWACKNPAGDHVQLKSLKNKIDYARQHDIELFYNVAHLERNLTSYWAKLPIIRKLMLTHPEIEWFFWVDADAYFTDMLFEIPIEKYDDYNMVMWGWEENLYKNRSWVAINDGAFLFRNCQWSLDLLDMWAPMGPDGDVRKRWGEFFSEYMAERAVDFPADDQSALVYLILNKTELQTKIKLEWDYELSGYWALFVDKFEEFMTTPDNHPGLGGKTWPFITHFTGCQPCTGNHNPKYSAEECALQMDRAYNFADNQVLQTMGFMHENLNSSHVRKIREESDDYNVLESVGPDTWASASESYGL